MRCALLLAVGTTLQLAFGDVPAHLLHWPWNAVIAANYLYLLVLAFAFSDRSRFLRTLWDDRACVSSMVSVLVMTIVYGLVRQDGSHDGLTGVLGFTRMSSSWPFCLILFHFMTSLGIRSVSEAASIVHIGRHCRNGSWRFPLRSIARTAAHISLYVLIFAGMFGSGDKTVCRVTARTGVPVGMHASMDGEAAGLPFTVLLREFSMDEYPPELHLLDTAGNIASEEYLSVTGEGVCGVVGEWSLYVDRYMDMAGRMPGDTAYRAMRHVGAVPAVYVVAENKTTGERRSGWVSCGSRIFRASFLGLDGETVIFMPPPEARGYLSRITVADGKGRTEDFDVEVNHPARFGSWRIYQTGYDTSAGKWSSVSVLECVRDPWYWLVHAALWVMLASGLLMFLASGGRDKADVPVEKAERREVR